LISVRSLSQKVSLKWSRWGGKREWGKIFLQKDPDCY